VSAASTVTDFLAGLQRCGTSSILQGNIVTFAVEAASGTRAGQPTMTGVSVDELTMWPTVPPHWLHFPAEITFAQTNIDANDTLPGWLRHSRQIVGWGDAHEHAQAWIAHVRSVLESAS
jgi:hypothetical protein